MGNENLVKVLDKLIERSERWSKDAEKRKDLNQRPSKRVLVPLFSHSL